MKYFETDWGKRREMAGVTSGPANLAGPRPSGFVEMDLDDPLEVLPRSRYGVRSLRVSDQTASARVGEPGAAALWPKTAPFYTALEECSNVEPPALRDMSAGRGGGLRKRLKRALRRNAEAQSRLAEPTFQRKSWTQRAAIGAQAAAMGIAALIITPFLACISCIPHDCPRFSRRARRGDDHLWDRRDGERSDADLTHRTSDGARYLSRHTLWGGPQESPAGFVPDHWDAVPLFALATPESHGGSDQADWWTRASSTHLGRGEGH